MASTITTFLRDAGQVARHHHVAFVGDPPILADLAAHELVPHWGPIRTVLTDQEVADALSYSLMFNAVRAEPAESVKLELLLQADIKVLAVWHKKPSPDDLKAFSMVVEVGPLPSDGSRFVQFVNLLAERAGGRLDQAGHDIVRVRLGQAQDRIDIELRKVMLGVGCLSAEALQAGLSSHQEAGADLLADAWSSGSRQIALALTLGAIDRPDCLTGAVRMMAYRLKLARLWQQSDHDGRDFCRRYRLPSWRFGQVERTAHQFTGDRYGRAVEALCLLEEAVRTRYGLVRTSRVLQAVRRLT